MSTKYDLVIFGAGGFGRELAWQIEDTLGINTRLCFLVDDAAGSPTPYKSLPVTILDSMLQVDMAPCLIAVGSPTARREIDGRLLSKGFTFATFVHRTAQASHSVNIGAGSIVCAGVIATVDISIGRHAQIHVNCTIGHDVVIGDYVTLSPGVRISGNVVVDEGVFIGTGASVINGSAGHPLRIGAGATVAAGACVTKDVLPGTLVAGVPAIRKR